jgi:hypothetical protein
MQSLLLAAALAVATAQQNSPDPVKDFCRRHQHQTCIIDSILYIDGGKVFYGGSVEEDSVAEQSQFLTARNPVRTNQRRHRTVVGGCSRY